MIGKSSMHSSSLMKKLLSHFAQQEKAPPNFMGRGDSGGSIVLGLACKFLFNLLVSSIIETLIKILAGIWNMLTFGLASPTPDPAAKDAELQSPLANQSLILILVLVSHCTCEKDMNNPYREALFTFSNSNGKTQNNFVRLNLICLLIRHWQFNEYCQQFFHNRLSLDVRGTLQCPSLRPNNSVAVFADSLQ
jgi:hypothetical protein